MDTLIATSKYICLGKPSVDLTLGQLPQLYLVHFYGPPLNDFNSGLYEQSKDDTCFGAPSRDSK